MGGAVCLWSGVMELMSRCGLAEGLSRLFRPLLRHLFPSAARDSEAMNALSANFSANLLGLGNAATPLGITAMKELAKLSPQPGVATHHMAMFVVLNTAALDLLPTTTGLLRMQAGSAAPFDILPAVWLASSASVVIGVVVTKLLGACLKGRG
jgi:spore maturation protein A